MLLFISTLFLLLMSINPDLHAETKPPELKVLAFAGSLRTDSVNKKLIREAAAIAKELGGNVTLVDLKDYPIPLYDGDIESGPGMPEKAKNLRRMMIEAQVVMISTPEYNSSLPAVLKNVIDWASRNEEGKPSRDAFKGNRKFVIMAASPGKLGGTRALKHLRGIIEELGGVVDPQQFSIADAYNAFDESGHLKDPEKKNELRRFLQSAIQ
jgi:chromate reductase